MCHLFDLWIRRGHPCGWVTLAPKEDFLLINNCSGAHACGCVRCTQKLEQEKPVHAIQDSRESVSSDGPIMWPIYWPAKPRWSLDHEWLDHYHGWIGGGACIWFLWNGEHTFTFSSKELCIPGHHTNDLGTVFIQEMPGWASCSTSIICVHPGVEQWLWNPTGCIHLEHQAPADAWHKVWAPPAQLFHFSPATAMASPMITLDLFQWVVRWSV